MGNHPHQPTTRWARRPSAVAAVLLLGFGLLYTASLLPSSFPPHPDPIHSQNPSLPCGGGDLSAGRWARDPRQQRRPLYDGTCPFHRNAWNCLRNGRENMDTINSWVWFPDSCGGAPLPRIDPAAFLAFMRGRRIGFVGDSLNENFLTSFLCTLRSADEGARKWKRKGVWRGGYFPKFDVTVGYHRAVLLARYMWGDDKFPKERPLVFYREGKPIIPPLGIRDGLKVVLESMLSYIEREVPKETLKFWRTQSPRHFYGGEWDHNGSCLFSEPLRQEELDSWFHPRNRGVNKEAREVNFLIEQSLQGTDIQLLNLTHISELRADAHPAIWLGKKDAVAIWGQDCMHWCLPGLPDTWVDILAARIMYNLEAG